MDDWDGFYALTGGTAGTLIGLIFVVIALGMDHAKEGDTDRLRLFVTPILVYFASLLIIALAMVPPTIAQVSSTPGSQPTSHPIVVPKIWDAKKLADWATPLSFFVRHYALLVLAGAVALVSYLLWS